MSLECRQAFFNNAANWRRQGSPAGRTLLMSPAMVAAAALAGRVVDVREVL